MVLRTFVKTYGLAALRIGYGVAAPDLVDRIARWQLPCDTDRIVRLTAALPRGIAVKSYDGAGVRITVADRSASDAVMRILAGWEP
ncbi:hypothetical protein [Nocardia sp. bgisy134]|uniref:hypothetical protein n=1 Tax=unclassified Nocardia TaxID=2637762 RepID=UPI003D74651B